MQSLQQWTMEQTEEVTISGLMARIIASIISMSMIMWIMYAGLELICEPRSNPRYNHLTLLVGALSIVFGVIHFIQGFAIIMALVLELLGWLQLQDKKLAFAMMPLPLGVLLGYQG